MLMKDTSTVFLAHVFPLYHNFFILPAMIDRDDGYLGFYEMKEVCQALSQWRHDFNIQYITRNMHTVFALLCFVVVIHWLIFPYPSGLLHWHCGNLTIAPVPAKQPWWTWINTSCQFIVNDCITTTKQSTTKPCAYFLGYTVLDQDRSNSLDVDEFNNGKWYKWPYSYVIYVNIYDCFPPPHPLSLCKNISSHKNYKPRYFTHSNV